MNCPLLIKLAADHTDHETLGHFFSAYSYKHEKTAVYYCDAWVENYGFWMTNIEDRDDRKNVSERAIGRTYHEVRRDSDRARCEALFAANVLPYLHQLDPLAGSRYESTGTSKTDRAR